MEAEGETERVSEDTCGAGRLELGGRYGILVSRYVAGCRRLRLRDHGQPVAVLVVCRVCGVMRQGIMEIRVKSRVFWLYIRGLRGYQSFRLLWCGAIVRIHGIADGRCSRESSAVACICSVSVTTSSLACSKIVGCPRVGISVCVLGSLRVDRRRDWSCPVPRGRR